MSIQKNQLTLQKSSSENFQNCLNYSFYHRRGVDIKKMCFLEEIDAKDKTTKLIQFFSSHVVKIRRLQFYWNQIQTDEFDDMQ